ncbi:MAG TPA: SMP-30/gluconolactonase/LRE family protein [Myxococcota bacterium]
MGERVFIGLRAVLVVTVALMLSLLALPSPMRSAAWTPPRQPNLEGPFAPNELLAHAEKLAPGQLVGPESIAIDGIGRIYAGTTDGKIVRVLPGLPLEVFTETGGRPLGMAFLPNGDLIVADVMKGLLRVDPSGAVEVLAHEAEGQPFTFLNAVATTKDGKGVYMTDSSDKWGYGDQIEDILEQMPSGRLIRFDIAEKDANVLVRGLAFANGLALAPDESFALVAETARYRITKVMLTGDKRNIPETFIDNLPGFPDDISLSPRGTYWVALYSVRKPMLDAVHPLPFVKDCLAGLPDFLRPRPIAYGLVFEMDAAGHAIRSFHDPDASHFRDVTSAVESGGVVYLGTLTGTSIGRLTP